MPKLNRIRIANVSYDGKYIMDQIYDTYGGENTLFNLANGSGKSVLVQMILQPILPCERIHGRKIESYLSKSSSPTYVMLEWKLDHTVRPIYFMTGIAMCSIPQGDESTTRVKYFTFTHKYDASTEYDIAHTPLIAQSGGGYHYMPYDEAFNLLKNVKNELSPLHCYARDRSEAYQEDLSRHRIFADEWKLLAKINNEEGGVDEVFSDCKSSDALLNKWILKTISDKTGQKDKQLREMFYALISSVLAQEETLKEKELLEGFLQDIDRLSQSLSGLLQHLDSLRHIEGLLAGRYHHLSLRVNEIEDEKQDCEDKERELAITKKLILYEQLSESWHDSDEKYKLCKESLDERKSITDSRRAQHEKAKLDMETMMAADYREKTLQAADSIAACLAQLERLKDGLHDQDAQDVFFSLDSRYAEMISQNDEKLRKVMEETEDAQILLNKHRDENALIDKEKQEISQMLGILKEKLESFAVYEAKCLESLGISIRRTLAHELSEDDVDSARKLVYGEQRRLSLLEDELLARLDADMKKKEALGQSWKMLTEELNSAANRIANREEALSHYDATVETLNEISMRRGLSADIKSIPDNLRMLRESGIQQKAELSDWNAQLANQRDTLTRFDANSLHTAPAFGKLLRSKGVDYITGENYLKDKSADEQRTILSKNPMLPFCFLVGRSDFEKAAALHTDGIDRVCPILILEKAEENLGVADRAVSLTDFGRAMCYYYEESFTPESQEAFRARLEEAVILTEKSCAEWGMELSQLEKDMAFLENFPYDSDSGRTLSDSMHDAQSEHRELSERRKIEEQESSGLEASCAGLRDEISLCREADYRAGEKVRLFDEYLSKDAEYILDIENQQRQTGKKENLNRRFAAISDDIDKLNNRISGAGIEKSELGKEIEDLKRRRREITAPVSGQLLDWPLEALERRFEEIVNKQTEDEKLIRYRLGEFKKKKDEAEKSLSKYRYIPSHEIERVSYSESRLELLEKEEQHSSQKLSDAENGQAKANENSIKANTERDSCRNRLRDEGWDEPLARREIIGDYVGRTAQINEHIAQLGLRKKALDKERDACQQDIYQIIGIIGKPMSKNAPPSGDGLAEVDIDEQSARYKETNSIIRRLSGEAAGIENEIKMSYSQRHSAIEQMLKAISVAQCALEYEAFHAVFERLAGQRNIMKEAVRVLETRLEHLDSQKENVVFHAFAQGKMLYNELNKISKSSRVKLPSDNRSQQTLKIGIPDELDASAQERIREHIGACVADMRREKSEGVFTEKMLRSFIDAKLSDRELLNQVIGRHTIDVRLLKVDAFQANTKLRTWESVLTDNSGGELFVSCFVLLSALMDYSRKSILPEDSSGRGTKVMLIDNPFGKTSSPHLLEALIQVAKQFDMQMICLSDLSQSSITSMFPLIYQLSLRPAIYGGKSYLKTDSISRNVPLHTDHRLENIHLRNEQISLF